VPTTNEFHKFCWSTISGTSDDGKAPYEPKSMHTFIMSKIRHSHRQYDTREWRGTKHGLNRAMVWPAGHVLEHLQNCFVYVSSRGGAQVIQCPKAVQGGILATRPSCMASRPDKWAPHAQYSATALPYSSYKYHGAPSGRKCKESEV
jgi:hypothetical protein